VYDILYLTNLSMRKLVTVQKILDIQPIQNADSIEVSTIKGWHCVVKKGEFKIGDKCVFFEVDSFVPAIKQFEFLGEPRVVMLVDGQHTGYRIKTIRLRGQISQGIVLPLSEFSQLSDYEEDIECGGLLGVVKYEKPIPANLQGQMKGNFPSFIPKTDEERIQNCPYVLDEYKDVDFVVTEKIDGTSATYYKKDGVFGMCSRNWEMKPEDSNVYSMIAKKYELESWLPDGIAIQGEIVGPGIQGNKLKLGEQKLFIFNVYNINTGKYLTPEEIKVCMINTTCEMVPTVSDMFQLPDSVDALVEYANGKSIFGDFPREGIVLRPKYQELQHTKLGRVSFKAISPEFLLHYGE
jgi:RNA ligase (TIGR02306 family)